MNSNLLHALPVAIAGALWLGLRKAGTLFWHCYERRQQRLVLAALDAHQLRDLGFTRDQAMSEAEKAFWR